jgi:lipopolysaccharide transport system ATP-binding protein
MSYLKVHNIGKAYKRYPGKWARLAEWITGQERHEKHWVLRDISFEVAPGEAVGIIGINGAGKSTLLKIITGTTQPTTGSVEIGGRVAALLELGMGFHPDFTGRQNVYMGGQINGLFTEQISELMPKIEDFAEIGDYIDQPLRTYSSGMQMRLAFAVATSVRPDILIVDEALSVGDAYFQAKCYQRIAHFKKQGTTLILVSHSVGDIVKHCERALLVEGGGIEIDSSSREATNLYLDELFGKRMRESTCPVIDSSETSLTFARGADDNFHTHPGYRKEEHRWGHGGAAIIDYLIIVGGERYPSRIESNAPTDFYFKVRFDAHFDNIVPGFLIKTLEGIFLYGTNSFISSGRREAITASPGEVMLFKFSLPMTLNEGHYLISFGISAGDPLHQLTPLERRYDSVIIYVSRALQFWGIVDMEASFETCERLVCG